jgi:hypothetical protein
MRPLIQAALGLKLGVVSSGNSLDYTDRCMEIMGQHQAAVKEMEAAAIAWVCELFGTPLLCIKSITDIVDGGRCAGCVGRGWEVSGGGRGERRRPGNLGNGRGSGRQEGPFPASSPKFQEGEAVHPFQKPFSLSLSSSSPPRPTSSFPSPLLAHLS